MNFTRVSLLVRVLMIVLVALLPALAGAPANTAAPIIPPGGETTFVFDRVIPLGVDACLLTPANRVLYLMVSANSDDFRGMRQITRGTTHVLYSRDGQSVKYYPERLSFRVTVSTRTNALLDVDPLPVATKTDSNEYLLNLRFRLKIFHGLHKTEFAPD